MSQTVVLEQNAATESITLKFNDHASSSNPSPSVDSKLENLTINDTDSKPDTENQTFTINFDDHDQVISIPNVDSQTEAAVNEFLRKHGSSEDEEVRTEAMNELKSFLEQQEIGTLLVLVKFASDVNKTDLFEVLCQRIADVIKDKSVEEVREIFNITNDFTPEEEQAIRDEHAWAFED